MTERRACVLFLLLALPACGSNPDASTAQAEQAVDTTIKPLEREPLTEADFVDLEMADLSLEVPWTRNAVNRTPAPTAPRSVIESVEVAGYDGFDRLTFTFSSDAPAPGYQIRVVPSGLAVRCGEATDSTEAADGEYAPDVSGNQFLVVRLRPARIIDQGRRTMSIGTERFELTRFYEGGVSCDADDIVTWIVGLSEGSNVRLLQLRSPPRLVVDVR